MAHRAPCSPMRRCKPLISGRRSRTMLEVAELRGGYGDLDVLQGVSLRVDNGEIVTIAGTNGSGKSTLGKALVGLLPRCSGAVHLDGQDLARVPTHARLEHGIFHV